MARKNKLYKLAGRKASGELKKLSKVNCAMLPPCEKALWMKVKRPNLIAIVCGEGQMKKYLRKAWPLGPSRFWIEMKA